MRRVSLPNLILVLGILAVAGPAAANEPCAKPFDDASIVPADVSLYLQVEDAAKLRRELDGWQAGAWLTEMISGDAVAGVWSSLCDRMNASEPELFDSLFGERCTLVTRDAPILARQNAAREWAVILHIDEAEGRKLVRRLRGTTPWPVSGVMVTRIPEQRMLIGRLNDRLIAGPSDQPGLFNDIVRRMGGQPIVGQPVLAHTPSFEQTHSLGGGQVSVYVRNPESSGGHSYLTAWLRKGRVYLRQVGEFERSPFSRPVTTTEIDPSPLRSLEENALAVFIEPTDIGDTMVERFLSTSFGAGLVNAAMREAMGDRRLIVIGEEEGRLRDTPEDILAPTLAIAYECEDADAPIGTILDAHVPGLAAGFSNRLGAMPGAPALDVMWNDGAPRRIDLSPAASHLTGNLPIFNSLVLSWGEADGECGRWFLLGTHDGQIQELARVLEATSDCGRKRRIDSAGSINGVRLARHLASWGDRADELAIPGKEQQFRDSVSVIAGLLESLEHVRFRMFRPTRSSMQLDLELQLVPPHSEQR